MSEERRCPSINPMDIDDRCKLTVSDPHEYGHEGYWKERKVAWDHSSIEVSNTSADFWELVE